jgi:hypothetical protein
MVALANLYTILDVSIQQLVMGLATLPLLVALAWYVSDPVHRSRLSVATRGPAARARSRGHWSQARALPPRACFELAPLLPQGHGTGGEIIGRRIEV